MDTSITESPTPATARERFLTRARRVQQVTIEGDTFDVIPLSLKDRQDVIQSSTDDEGAQDGVKLAVRLVIACVCLAGTTTPVFSKGDEEALAEMPAVEMDALAAAALTANGLSAAAREAARGN